MIVIYLFLLLLLFCLRRTNQLLADLIKLNKEIDDIETDSKFSESADILAE